MHQPNIMIINGGDRDGSCARLKTEQYEIRGARVKPYRTHAIRGGRDIHRSQGSDVSQTFGRSAMTPNLWPSSAQLQRSPHPVSQFPSNPVQSQQSFQVSGVVKRGHQPRMRKRMRGVSLALNQDPIDSFERAVAGDEFDNRSPVEPIRVIKVESAEVLEPVGPTANTENNQMKTRKIIESLTRHMKQIARPKVISLSNRDEIINGQVISQPDIKITKVETTKETAEVAEDLSSKEIASGIVDNLLNDNAFANNASMLLRVLTNQEQTSTGASETNMTTLTTLMAREFIASTSVPSKKAGNSTKDRFNSIEESLKPIGSEMDDYNLDDDDDLPNAVARSTVTGRGPMPPSATPPIMTIPLGMTMSGTVPTTLASTTQTTQGMVLVATVSVTPSTTTQTTATTASQASTSIKTTTRRRRILVGADPEVDDGDFGDDEENEEFESALAVMRSVRTTRFEATSMPTTTISATKSSEEESSEEEDAVKTTTRASVAVAEDEEMEPTTLSSNDAFRAAIKAQREEALRMRKAQGGNEEENPSTELTELNSDTIKTIEREMKAKRRLERLMAKKTDDDNKEGKAVKGEKGKKKVKKIKTTKVVVSTNEEADTTTTKSSQKQDVEDEETREEEKPETKLKMKLVKKIEEEVAESLDEEPRGAGAQLVTDIPEEKPVLQTVVKHTKKTVVSIKKPNKGKSDSKEELKAEEEDEEMKEDEEEEIAAEEEVQNNTAASAVEEVVDMVETSTAGTRKKIKTTKGKKSKTKTDGEQAIEDKNLEGGEILPMNASFKIGGEDTNIRTDKIMASLRDAPNAKYYYPPKVMVPLPTCFYNPSGYVCCNLQLNNLIEDTFEEIKAVQGFSACNIAKMANIMQQKSEQMFGHPFESIVALSDFAQNVHFAGDLVCKVEIDGKYMLTYATPYDADHAVEGVEISETPAPIMEDEEGVESRGRNVSTLSMKIDNVFRYHVLIMKCNKHTQITDRPPASAKPITDAYDYRQSIMSRPY
ncbi:unnamed protein product [Cylicocyclus nassatus]|uniref:Ground-like domain-containing protein n=1 Tax=Cylicocyclus nassatus TaxID=53992 RepID=A0AA36DKD0_CYLNA|nr:unnamed protein product [Cylicocyclus nassatus]